MQNPSIVLYGAKNARLEEKPIPELTDPHHVLVRISYVGVCGSDVHFWHHGGIGKMVNPTSGIIMGHEASGTIHSIGPAVTRVSVGDRVALEPCLPCRSCTFCKSGCYNLCRKMRFAAAPGPPDTPGCLSKYYSIAEDFVYKIPPHLSLQEAVLVEPLAVGVHAVKMGDVRPGETVVVMGSGTVGMLCAAVASEFGALRVIVVDVLWSKVEFAEAWLGVETFLADTGKSAEENASALLEKFGLGEEGTDTTGGKVDTVIEASGAASSIEAGIHLLRPGGKFVQTGLGRPRIEFPIVAMSQKELMVRGCFRYGAGDYELAVQYLDKKKINVKPLISSVTKFEDATAAWDKTARGEGIKNLIEGVRD
ncbi:chaperonin 10-like protein [Phaeosphaeria sp. MPI-PUGE-AT-0046c]|nr:chaperonin 10-like protein [Phaeosphaeria sp. MPI-PUGE-AT-0046c]